MALSIAREAAALAHPILCPLCGTSGEANVIALPGIRIDVAARRAWVHGAEIALSRKEFDLLAYFGQRPGAVVTKRELYRDVWGFDVIPDSTRTVDSHMSRLRRKLDIATGGVAVFGCVWGVGWRLNRD
jgi:two-component system, OmpR family, response regulator ResD